MIEVKRCIKCRVMKDVGEFDYINSKTMARRRRKITCRACLPEPRPRPAPLPDPRDFKPDVEGAVAAIVRMRDEHAA